MSCSAGQIIKYSSIPQQWALPATQLTLEGSMQNWRHLVFSVQLDEKDLPGRQEFRTSKTSLKLKSEFQMYVLRHSGKLSSIYLLKAGLQHPTRRVSVGTSTIKGIASLATQGFLNNPLTGYGENFFCFWSGQKKNEHDCPCNS